MALMQHKQDLVKAIKAEQYPTAAAVLEKALTLAPEDAMLLEFQAVVQAKLRLDNDESSSDDDDEPECSQSSGSAGSADEQEQGAGIESTDEEDSCCSSDAGDDEICGAAVQTSGTAATAALNGEFEKDVGQLQPLQHSSQQDSHVDAVSSISLAAGSSTWTPQRRLELKQQLAASISQQRDELVRQQLMQSDPLLAAL